MAPEIKKAYITAIVTGLGILFFCGAGYLLFRFVSKIESIQVAEVALEKRVASDEATTTEIVNFINQAVQTSQAAKK